VSDWLEPVERGTDGRSGVALYGEAVIFDFNANEARCNTCGYRLGDALSDFRQGTLAETTPVDAAGPVRGQDYGMDRVRLILFYCPGCGRQLDCEISTIDMVRPGFVLQGQVS
jgi:hypothetical protein